MAGTLRLSNTGTGNGQSTITTAASGDTTYTLPSGGGTFVTTGSTESLTVPFALGSASAPSVTFIGDTNTGLYSPGADQVAISTNSAGRLFINSSGQVGIGATPAHLLHLTGTTPAMVFTHGTSGTDARVKSNVNGDVVFEADFNNEAADSRIGFEVDGSERMRLDSSGRLGLGTSSPGAGLHLVSAGQTTSALNTAGDLNTIISDTGISAGNGGSLVFAAASGQWRFASIKGLVTNGSNNTQGDIVFSTRQNATDSALTERVRIDSQGRLGVGTSTFSAVSGISGAKLQVLGGAVIGSDGASSNGSGWLAFDSACTAPTTAKPVIYHKAGTGLGIKSDYEINFEIGASDAVKIDNSRRLLVGTSSTSYATTILAQGNSTGSTSFGIYKACVGTASPANGAQLGAFRFCDSNHVESAEIGAYRDGGTWTSTTSQPTRLVFSTTADGASSPTERMRIANDGAVVIGKTSVDDTTAGFAWRASQYFSAVRSGGAPGYINRLTNDGVLLEFAQDSTTEGTISVSGTTVSYNGAHLSRWSQLPSGAERIEILRGTVLSNIDEMCEWGDEDNEQLNRMKVSDVEGDKNVAGVFQAWDDDDDTYTNDFYCAMTGDFIIRIGAGVSVERGDLLMSAGDGTAKPQDDDIIRSKTIAKVTSTNVSCTYPDGSYCVPCVLMAC